MMLDMQQKLHCCEKLQKKAINSAAVGELRSSWLSSARRIVKGDKLSNVINLKRLLNGKQNVWKYQNGEEKSDSDGREKDV